MADSPLPPLSTRYNTPRTDADRQTGSPSATSTPTPKTTVAEPERVWLQPMDGQARDDWYETPQGSHLIPYDTFLVLEQAGSTERFTSPEHLRRLGLVYGPKGFEMADGLPLGLLKDTNKFDQKDYLGLTCAACHTGTMKVAGKELIVEGGQGSVDVGRLLRELQTSLDETLKDDAKRQRYLDAMKARGRDQAEALGLLEFSKVRIDALQARNRETLLGGPGRLDAVSSILNTSSGTNYQNGITNPTANNETRLENTRELGAPVSFPLVARAAARDRVQTNGLTNRPDSRNHGEVTGVFGGIVQVDGKWRSAGKMPELFKLEEALKHLPAPKWNEALMGKLDAGLVAKGRQVFEREGCDECHASPAIDTTPEALAKDKQRKGLLKTEYVKEEGTDGKVRYFEKVTDVPASKVGTDQAFVEIHGSRYLNDPLLVSTLDKVMKGKIAAAIDEKTPGVVEALREAVGSEGPLRTRLIAREFEKLKKQQLELGLRRPDGSVSELILLAALNAATIQDYFAELKQQDPSVDVAALAKRYSDYRAQYSPTQLGNYIARPLYGVAFTAPYLHNGSVPTLDALFSKQRPGQFAVDVGSFDPDAVGLDYRCVGPDAFPFVAETADGKPVPGNSNVGHDYGTHLDEGEKRALIEYLKSL